MNIHKALMKLSVDAAGAAEAASPWYDAVKNFRLTRSAVAGAGSGAKSFVANRFMPEPVVALNRMRKAKDKVVSRVERKQDEIAVFNRGKDLTERGLDTAFDAGKKMLRGATEGAVDYGKTMAEGLGTAGNAVRSAVPAAPNFGSQGSIYQRGAKWLTNVGSDVKNISTGLARGEAGATAEGATSLASRLPSSLPTVAKYLPSAAKGTAAAAKVFGKVVAPLAVVDAASGGYNLGKNLDLAGLNAKYNPVWGGINRGVAAGTEQALKSDAGRNVVNAVEGGLEGADKILSHPYKTFAGRFKGLGSALATPIESARDFGRGVFGSSEVDASNLGPGRRKKAGLDIAAVMRKLADAPDLDMHEHSSPEMPEYSPPSVSDRPKTKAKPTKPAEPKMLPMKGHDGPGDAAAERKAKQSLKGAKPLPRDFSWPRKMADFMSKKPAPGTDASATGPAVDNSVFNTNKYAPNVPAGPSGPPIEPPKPSSPFASESTTSSNMGAPATTTQSASPPAKARSFNPGNFSAQS